jgi:hypothetical protein
VSELSEVEGTTVAIVEDLEELTPDEERERHRLELRVERAFYEAGAALRELRDRRLYRSTHKTFEEYCQYRFGYHRRHSYQLINAAAVVENLCANSAQTGLGTKNTQILPTSEYQIRPLTKLEPVEQLIAWQQAVEEADGKVPSGRIVKGIVERLKEKPLFVASNFCQVGDVFILKKLEGTERKYNGCWAIANEVREFSVVVDVHDGILSVKPENLNPIDSPDVRRQLPVILERIRRLRNVGFLDRGAYNILEDLGRQTYLTDVEEKILSCLEEHYGVKP